MRSIPDIVYNEDAAELCPVLYFHGGYIEIEARAAARRFFGVKETGENG